MKIKNCPFCNSKAGIRDTTGLPGYKFWIMCTNADCKAVRGLVQKTKEQAIKVWNDRYTNKPTVIIEKPVNNNKNTELLKELSNLLLSLNKTSLNELKEASTNQKSVRVGKLKKITNNLDQVLEYNRENLQNIIDKYS